MIQGIVFPYSGRITRYSSRAQRVMNWDICAWKSLGGICCFFVLHTRLAIWEIPLHQFQGSCWFKYLSLKRRKRPWVFQNISQLTGGRTIFLIVMGLKWDRQEKYLTQFQQFILIVMIKKGKYWKGYNYYNICSRNVKYHCISTI